MSVVQDHDVTLHANDAKTTGERKQRAVPQKVSVRSCFTASCATGLLNFITPRVRVDVATPGLHQNLYTRKTNYQV